MQASDAKKIGKESINNFKNIIIILKDFGSLAWAIGQRSDAPSVLAARQVPRPRVQNAIRVVGGET